jgi:hypothetical protein
VGLKPEEGVMLGPIFALILVGIGFVAGYGLRASKSRKRRAAALEEWLWRRDQKRYDDGHAPKSPSIVFLANEELEATAISDQLAETLRH